MNLKELMEQDWLSLAPLPPLAAFHALAMLRWPQRGEPVCPECGGLGASYVQARKNFFCPHCAKSFTVKSKTLLARAPMDGLELLRIIFAARDRVEPREVAERLGLAESLVARWMAVIQEGFGEEALFPTEFCLLDDEGSLHSYQRPQRLPDQRLRQRMAAYLLIGANRKKRVRQVLFEFLGEDPKEVENHYKNLAHWPKERLCLLSQGQDPFAASQTERERLQKKSAPGRVACADFFTPFEEPDLQEELE